MRILRGSRRLLSLSSTRSSSSATARALRCGVAVSPLSSSRRIPLIFSQNVALLPHRNLSAVSSTAPSTPSSAPAPPGWSYEEASEQVMMALTDAFDDLDAKLDIPMDVAISHGVLNVVFSDNTWVVNKQAPTEQIWLSSPISGPWHYYFDHASQTWICTKDGHEFFSRLQREITEYTGKELVVPEITY